MIHFAVYDSNGDILRTGVCQECDASIQASDGEYVYIGKADELTQKVVDGELVSKSIDPVNNAIRELRLSRNTLLSKTDWTQLPDANVDKQAWADYRQALRDLPSQYPNLTDISEVVWPEPPVL